MNKRSSGWGGFEGDRWQGGFEPPPADPTSTDIAPKEQTKKRRYAAAPDIRFFRRVTSLLFLVAAIATSIAHLLTSSSPSTSSPPPAPAVKAIDVQSVYYGDPVSFAALKTGKANNPARAVCDEEIRYEPTTGHWHCAGWAILGDKDVGRVAHDPGGPCTHRLAGMDSPAWKCVATLPVPQAARNLGRPEHGVIFGDMRDGSDLCSEEARPSSTNGAWQCTNWRPIPPGFRFVEAVASPGPCAFRVADQQTGEWTCNPPYPGN